MNQNTYLKNYSFDKEGYVMDNIQIVNNIKKLCVQNNISISQLEKIINISPGLISRWKDKTPTLDRLIDISNFFNVTIDTLINGEDSSKTDGRIPLLIRTLYQKTQNIEIDWEVLDVDNPPIQFTKLVYDNLSNKKCDYYYTVYENGCFILSKSYTDSYNKVVLYVIPDSDSLLQSICNNYEQLHDLFNLVSNNLRKELNNMKANKFISSFLNNATINNLNENSLDKTNNEENNIKSNIRHSNVANFNR